MPVVVPSLVCHAVVLALLALVPAPPPQDVPVVAEPVPSVLALLLQAPVPVAAAVLLHVATASALQLHVQLVCAPVLLSLARHAPQLPPLAAQAAQEVAEEVAVVLAVQVGQVGQAEEAAVEEEEAKSKMICNYEKIIYPAMLDFLIFLPLLSKIQ